MQRNTATRFASRAALRAWLERNHASATELLLRCYKMHARDKGVTYPEALEEALCFGWIDGVRRALDDDSFVQRFSPRRPGSPWSQVNLKRFEELKARGLVAEAGLEAHRDGAGKPTGYSFESRPVTLAPKYMRQLKANPDAFEFFQQQAPWYRRTSAFWVMSAKQEATRQRRLESLIECSARRRPIGPLARKGQK